MEKRTQMFLFEYIIDFQSILYHNLTFLVGCFCNGMICILHKHIRLLFGFFKKLRTLNRSDNCLAAGPEPLT